MKQHRNQCEVRTAFCLVSHELSLLFGRRPCHACNQHYGLPRFFGKRKRGQLVERSETVDVVLPPTYKKLAMGPHILMRGLPTSPNEPSRICSHLRGRGLRSPVLRERPSGYLSTLILLHEPGESNLNTHLQVGRKPKKKEPSSVCRWGADGKVLHFFSVVTRQRPTL
jgi:hypothetical protein